MFAHPSTVLLHVHQCKILAKCFIYSDTKVFVYLYLYFVSNNLSLLRRIDVQHRSEIPDFQSLQILLLLLSKQRMVNFNVFNVQCTIISKCQQFVIRIISINLKTPTHVVRIVFCLHVECKFAIRCLKNVNDVVAQFI